MRRRDLTAGIVLLVVFVAMLWFGKPRNGVQLLSLPRRRSFGLD